MSKMPDMGNMGGGGKGGMPDFGGQLPEGFDPSQLPEGFDPSQMPSMNGGMPDFGGQMPSNGGFPANPPSGQNPFGSGMPPMFN